MASPALPLATAQPQTSSLSTQAEPLLAEPPASSSGCFSTGLGSWGLEKKGSGLQIPRRQPGQAESSEEAMREVTLSSSPILFPQLQIPLSTENMAIWRATTPILLLQNSWFCKWDTEPQGLPILQGSDQASPFSMIPFPNPQGL